MTYWFIDQEDTSPAVDLEIKPMAITEYMKCQAHITKRLNARCKGLLEIITDDSSAHHPGITINSNPFSFSTVDFLYRTLRDYLRIPKTQKLLLHWSAAKPDPGTAICKGMLAQIKTAPDEMKDIDETIDVAAKGFFYHAIALEEKDFPQSLEIRIINQIEDAFIHLPAFDSRHRVPWFKSSNAVLETAALAGLRRYVSAKIVWLSDGDLDKLLTQVVDQILRFPSPNTYRRLEIMTLILQKAGSVEQSWDFVLNYLRTEYVKEPRDCLLGIVSKVIKAFLEHGAEPHHLCKPDVYLRVSNSRGGQGDDRLDASKIIRMVLTADEVDTLGDLLPKEPLVNPSLSPSSPTALATGSVNSLPQQAQPALQPATNPPKRRRNFLKKLLKRQKGSKVRGGNIQSPQLRPGWVSHTLHSGST